MPLVRVQYVSAFTSEDDKNFCDLSNVDHFLNRGSYDELYNSLGIQEKLQEKSEAIAKEFGLDFRDLVREDQDAQKSFSEITSVVGDDEITTTNSVGYGPVSIVSATIVSKIRLSRKDCGISHRVGNYAEGWILLAPTKESDYVSVSKRHSGEGVSYVLDVVKLKQISAVRKQSDLDLDFASKYVRLYETASWVDTSWFTYDFHQMSLIVASMIFDFRSSINFPFLFREEGGIGGLPPYQNLETAFGALFHFQRGKSKNTILGIMTESASVQRLELKPKDTIYLKAVHLAQLGGHSWDRFESAYRKLLVGSSRMDVNDLFAILSEQEEIPVRIKEKGVELTPDDPLLGVAVSHLRTEGLILTDLDVKIMISSQRKFEALKGTQTMKAVLEAIETENTKLRKNPYVALFKLSEIYSETCVFQVVNEENRFSDSISILTGYYKEKTSGKFQTSFIYTDSLRIYKAQEVLDFLEAKTNFIRTDIVSQMKISKFVHFNPHIFSKTASTLQKMQWLDSKPLAELLEDPLPDGIGPDDSRILRFVLGSFKDNFARNFYIYTSDNGLIFNILAMLKREKYRNKGWTLTQIDKASYLRCCLETLNDPDSKDSYGLLRHPMYNFITKSYKTLDANIVSRARKRIRGPYKEHILVDFPNLERGLMNVFQLRGHVGTTIVERKGGFLHRGTINNSEIFSWASLPIDEFNQLPDFDLDNRTYHRYKHFHIDLERVKFWHSYMPD